MVECNLEVKSMSPSFSVPSVEVMGQARKNYLEPTYPRRRYDEQRTFSEGRARDHVLRGDKTLERALDTFQEHASLHSRYLQFKIEEEADLVQVIVRESNDEEKIIRKIPPDEIVRLIERRNEILGFLFDIVA